MAKETSLQEMFLDHVRDLFDAEKQLVKALPKMAKSVEDSELENAFREHLEQTKGQVQRLEQIFEIMESKARGKPCAGMKGIVEEGQEMLGMDEPLRDAAVAGAGGKVEHYEIAGYESARLLAQQLGMKDAAQLLQQTLQEEIQTSRLLSQISKRLVKEASRGAGMEMGEEEEEGGAGGRTSQRGQRSNRGRSSRGSQSSHGRSSGRSKTGGRSSRESGRKSTLMMTDHDEIREWAEERGAHPACVKGTGGRGDTGMIRLDFPGYSGDESLQEISWDDWFEKFDDNNLALLYQNATAGGQKSNFNKLVKRETAEAGRGSKPKARAAR